MQGRNTEATRSLPEAQDEPMTMILELPRDLQSQVEQLARQRGTDEQAIIIEATRALVGAFDIKSAETPDQKRDRIRAAIDDARAHFAPMLHGGDAVSQLMAEKRADVQRASERGL